MKRKETFYAENMSQTSLSNSSSLGNPRKISRKNEQEEDSINHEQKYDRQLRLWGNNGQQELTSAKVCLLNATAVSSEILKCLVLPGVGSYTIVDKHSISNDDLECNFFIKDDCYGMPRAQVVCNLIQELNRDSKGFYYIEEPLKMLDNDPEFFRKFTIVIASRLSEHDLTKFSNFLWQFNIPFVICDNFGFLGYMRISIKEHVVIESHPDNVLNDLRLDNPFPAFLDYINDIDLDTMDNYTHAHTPFLIILYKFLDVWRTLSKKEWPKTNQDKSEIKALIKQYARINESGLVEENFEEAMKNVNTAFTTSKIPDQVLQLFNCNMCLRPAGPNMKFWILVSALKEFVNQFKCLPLRGTLPDMFSDSVRYIYLQNLYKNKANEDVNNLTNIVRQVLYDLQLSDALFTEEEIKLFCKNSFFLHVYQGEAFHEELKPSVKLNFEEMADDFKSIYTTIRSIYYYLNTSNCLDGKDVYKIFEEISNKITNQLGISQSYSMDHFGELLRLNFNEVHVVASAMGGICAQEVIKIITKQYILLDNTFLYNAINQETTTVKLLR